MVEAAFALAGLAIGFAVAWMLGGRTREALAALEARAAEGRSHEPKCLF